MKFLSKCRLALFLLAIPCFAHACKLAPEVEHAMGYGAVAKICLKVCDDMGLPVSNASVRVIFDMLPTPYSVYGKTDTNGICIIEGKTNGNKVSFFVGKDGYYGSRKEMSYVAMGKEHDVKDGKWQPDVLELPVCLRPIKNPLKLCSALVCEYKLTGEIKKWIGYDLALNDYVKPYGVGEVSDFEVYLDWDRKVFPKCEQIGMKIRFTEAWSGYYVLPLDPESELKIPYSAMTNAVFSQDATYYDRLAGKRLRNTFDKSKCWVIRSRCKTDRQGHLVSANYSVARFLGISGGPELKVGFCFFGAFNPTPNDTNLEDIETAKQSRNFIRYCEPPASKW